MAPRLRVSAGPSVDRLSLVRVNDEDHPLVIDTPDFKGRITVRIQGFTGVRPGLSEGQDGTDREGGQEDEESASGLSTHYFDHAHAKGCTWSIQVQGQFKRAVCVDDVEYGNQFEKPIRDRLPWGTSVALRAINIIDPTLRHDLYSDQPWAFGPLITSMTRVNVKRLTGKAEEKSQTATTDFSAWPAFPSGHDETDYVSEDTSVLLCTPDSDRGHPSLLPEFEDEGLADVGTLGQLRDHQNGHTHRARFWANPSTRQAAQYLPQDVFTVAFDNAFIDFNTLRAVLPYTGGMGFDLQHYWDGQPVRYFCKDSRTDTVFFVIE